MLKKLSLSIFLTILLCPLVQVQAQESDPPNLVIGLPISPEETKWDTFGNADDEFHARLPKQPSVFSTYRRIKDIPATGHARVYSSYEDGIAYIIVVYDKSRKEATFDYFVNDFKSRFLSSWDMKFEHHVAMNSDDGKLYSLKKGDLIGAARVYVKPKHAYLVMAAGEPGNNAAVERLLDSFTMWDYPVDQMRGPSASVTGSDTASPASGGSGLALRRAFSQLQQKNQRTMYFRELRQSLLPIRILTNYLR